MSRRPVVAVLLLLGLLPALAHAHGDAHDAPHGAAAPAGDASAMTVDGLHVELAAHPALARGVDSHLVVRLSTGTPPVPASGGRVRIAFGPPGAVAEPQAAPETTWAGSYGTPVTPGREGPHRVQVLVEELPGRRFEPPVVLELAVGVGPAPGLGARVWLLLVAVAGAAGVGLYGIRLRARLAPPAGGALDLLAVPWVRRLFTSRFLQPALQVPLLVVMAVVVAVGLGDVQDGGKNLATKLTWTIWWAGIIFTFFLVGRLWCLACPFGALNEWTARLAAPARRLPAAFRNIWWATGLFVLLTWADEQLGVVRSPWVTAVIVLAFAGLAVGVGLFFERRSFCRHLCPIGGLIGIYAMTAPVELRAARGAVCAADRDKSCYRGSADAPGCPMFEFPGAMDRNNYCNLCGRCVTGCHHGNLVLRLRSLGQDLWAAKRRWLDESYLAIVLVGLTLVVTAEMLAAWPGWMSALARWLPGVVRESLKPATYLRLVESAVLLGGSLVVGPLLLLGAAALADRAARPHGLGLRRTFVTFGYMFVPIGLAMHLAHNLAHLLLEGWGIVPVVQRAAAAYTPLSLGSPDWAAAPLAPEPVVGLLQVASLVAFLVLALRTGHRLATRVYPDARVASRALVPLAALALLFTLAGIVLLSLPMGMRHGT